jgi:hypothetical protein
VRHHRQPVQRVPIEVQVGHHDGERGVASRRRLRQRALVGAAQRVSEPIVNRVVAAAGAAHASHDLPLVTHHVAERVDDAEREDLEVGEGELRRALSGGRLVGRSKPTADRAPDARARAADAEASGLGRRVGVRAERGIRRGDPLRAPLPGGRPHHHRRSPVLGHHLVVHARTRGQPRSAAATQDNPIDLPGGVIERERAELVTADGPTTSVDHRLGARREAEQRHPRRLVGGLTRTYLEFPEIVLVDPRHSLSS